MYLVFTCTVGENYLITGGDLGLCCVCVTSLKG